VTEPKRLPEGAVVCKLPNSPCVCGAEVVAVDVPKRPPEGFDRVELPKIPPEAGG
jgi:hypothetical protein